MKTQEPPEQEVIFLEAFERLESQLFRAWTTWAQRAHQVLDKKTESLIIVALDAVMHWPGSNDYLLGTGKPPVVEWPPPIVDHHIRRAYDAGATTQELVQAIVVAAQLTGGIHGLQQGLTALQRVAPERQAGSAALRRGSA